MTTPERPDDIKAVPVRHPGRWIAAVIVIVIAASIVRTVFDNPNFQWGVVGQYLFNAQVLKGVLATIYLTVASMVIGIVLGLIVAVMRLSPNPVLRGASWLYIFFFRATPLLVQIIFWYNITALFPHIDLGIPFGPSFIHANGNSLITKFTASLLALGLNEGAYMAEVVRGGIISVSEGQSEAATALGLTRLQTVRRIVLPQAIRVILPPAGNETISMLKNTSLVYIIAFVELLGAVTDIYSRTFQTIPLLIVACIWYTVMTSVLYVGQYFLEKKYGQGFSRTSQAGMAERWLGAITWIPGRRGVSVSREGQDGP